MIGNGTLVYLLPTLAVGLPHNLLGYGAPKTAHLQLNYPILCWNPLSGPLHLLLIKVQDFLNLE